MESVDVNTMDRLEAQDGRIIDAPVRTPGKSDLFQTVARHPFGWQVCWLKIVTKRGELANYEPNDAQYWLYHELARQQQRGLPVRAVVLKARQCGISTGVAARYFERINRRSNIHAVMASMDAVSTDKVFRMIRTFQEELPPDIRREPKRSNRKELEYPAPHRSGMLCQTAGTETLGRGGTTQYVHATEVAFWTNAENQLLGLLQEVPKLPETEVILESTANGIGGAFHDRYWQAVEQRKAHAEDYTGYLPLFLPWWSSKEYRVEPAAELCDQDGRLRLINDDPYFERDTREYLASLDIPLTDAQMYWRRVTIRDECGGDLRKFQQEYPATDREAFVATGYNIFSEVTLNRHEARCCDPMAIAEFCEREGQVRAVGVLRGLDCWKVWKWPERNHEYIVYGDVCEGLFSDTGRGGGDPDYHACGIFDRRSHELVATFHGRCDTAVYGVQMARAARFYREAIVSPEVNSCGLAVLNELKQAGYRNIYQRQAKEDEHAEETTSRLGYKTTAAQSQAGP